MVGKLNKEQLIAHLLECESSFVKRTESPLDNFYLDASIRELSLNKGELREAIGCNESQLNKWIAEMEDEGEYFERNSRQNYILDNEQVRTILKKAGIKTIPELRETNEYRVPVCIVNISKGGLAKSTTALTLAVSSALDVRKNQRVLLIDTDPQGSIVKHLCVNDLEYAYDTFDELIKEALKVTREKRLSDEYQEMYKEHIENILVESHLENLFIIPSNFKNSTIDPSMGAALANPNMGIDNVMTVIHDVLIRPILDDFDLVVIDTPPASNLVTAATYYAANHVTFVTTGRTQDYRSYVAHYNFLRETVENLMPSDFDGYESLNTLITRHSDKNDKLSKQLTTNVAAISSVASRYQTMIHENRTYETAAEHNLPVQLLDVKKDTSYREAMKQINQLYAEFNEIIKPSLFDVSGSRK